MIWDNINSNIENTMSANASSEEFLALGMQYCIGHGVAANNIIAHKWFNIAAMKGNDKARSYRFELAQEMTAAEVAEAQRQARAFLTVH